MDNNSSSRLYIDQPCERCGSKKRVSKVHLEKLETAIGASIIEVSQVICTNRTCQKLFEKNRAEDVLKINARKLIKEEADKLRKESIASTIAERKKNKMNLILSK